MDAAGALRAIQGALSSSAGPAALASFLKRLKHRASDGLPLPIHEDPQALRALKRLGVVSPSVLPSSPRAEQTVRQFLEQAARSGGPEPAIASVMIRAFAAGLYGVVTEAVCGDVPRCEKCPLARSCRERNLPAASRRSYGPGESPSERLATEGPEALFSEELLSVVAGAPRASEGKVADACERLLRGKDGLRGLANAKAVELAGAGGLTPRGARSIVASMELARRWAAEPRAVGTAFHSAADFFNHYRLRLRDLRKEIFISVLLDQKNRFLSDETCSAGTLTSSLVHPREVFRRAVTESAAAVAFVHNHPSGDPTPSGPDRDITSRLAEAAKIIGIRMLDHVIVGDTSFFSFLEQGML